MGVCGIIAEYNPLHTGHRFLLSQALKQSDAVVVAMSGNFTQRAEPALLSDRYRAEMALYSGANLVLQLPLPYAVSTAQTFARGGVSLLANTGLVDSLFFGSECGNIERLKTAANAVLAPETDKEILKFLEQGLAYPVARERAVEALFGEEVSAVLQNPNDILAVEYVRAILELQADMEPKTVKRQGAGHDAKTTEAGFASASYLRKALKNGEDIRAFLPEASFEILEKAMEKGFAPSDYSKLEMAILAKLRVSKPEDFALLPDASEGLENRLLTAAKTATSLEELFTLTKTKRYTHARIRRLVLSFFLGVDKTLTEGDVPYLRVLAADKTGIELLRRMEQTAKVPILKRAADAKALEGRAKTMYALECHATDLYNLTLPNCRPCGTEMTDAALFLQDF